jgi:hypothetical protein
MFQCPTDPKVFFYSSVSRGATAGGLFEKGLPLSRAEFSECIHVSPQFSSEQVATTPAQQKQVVSDPILTLAGNLFERDSTGISSTALGPKDLTA